jgi:hypothetical protein
LLLECKLATLQMALICVKELFKCRFLRSAAHLRHTFGFDEEAAAGPFAFG